MGGRVPGEKGYVVGKLVYWEKKVISALEWTKKGMSRGDSQRQVPDLGVFAPAERKGG